MAIYRYENPYRPGAGLCPPFFADRQDVLERARLAIGICSRGSATQSVCYYGLRGVGKTVLLRRIADEASLMSAQTLVMEARPTASLAALIVPALKQVLVTLSLREGCQESVGKALSVLRSFVNSIRVKFTDIEVSLDVQPAKGVADSGNYQQDLCDLLCRVGEVLKTSKTSLVIIIDEMQYLSGADLEALTQALHIAGQKNLPIVLIGAGLPVIIARSTEAKTYSERLYEFIELGPLSREDAKEALIEPALKKNVVYEAAAADLIVETTKGYPYFIQVWGRYAWASAEEGSDAISLPVVKKATQIARAALDASFFRSRMDRLTPKEKEFLFAMSEFDKDSIKMSDISTRLKAKSSALSPLRSHLIKKGVIYSPQYGEVAYSVPLFGEYLRRIR